MKTVSREEHAMLVGYLLGEPPETEREGIEERYLFDEQYGELLEELETDLVDAYVEGTLSRTQRRDFESHYLVTLERKTAVQAAYLAKVYRDRVANPLAEAMVRPGGKFILQWSTRTRQFVSVLAAGVAIAILGGGLWYFFDRGAVKDGRRFVAQNRTAAPGLLIQPRAQEHVEAAATAQSVRDVPSRLPARGKRAANGAPTKRTGSDAPPGSASIVENASSKSIDRRSATHTSDAPSPDLGASTPKEGANANRPTVAAEVSAQPIAPPPPPPTDPKEIKLGQTPDQVTATIGQPDKVINLGPKQIYVYKDMKLIFVGGKVSDVDANGDPNDPLTPHDPGIYLYTKDHDGKPEMIVLERAAYTGAKSGGMLGSALTYGIKNVKTKAVIAGAKSSIRVADTSPVFYFYFDDKQAGLGKTYLGVGNLSNPNQFALLKLEVKGPNRETVIGAYSSLGSSSREDTEAMVPFKSEWIRPGLYKVTVSSIAQGEYCFLASGGAGKVTTGPHSGMMTTTNAIDIFDFGASVN
jgi:hypothetical protein